MLKIVVNEDTFFVFVFVFKNILILKKDTHFAVWLHTSFLLNKHTVRVS